MTKMAREIVAERVKFSQLKAMNSTGNLLKAGFWTLSPSGELMGSRRRPGRDKVASGRAGSWKD